MHCLGVRLDMHMQSVNAAPALLNIAHIRTTRCGMWSMPQEALPIKLSSVSTTSRTVVVPMICTRWLRCRFDMSVFYNATHPVAATLIFLAFSCLTAILLINVLVAAMAASYQKARSRDALTLGWPGPVRTCTNSCQACVHNSCSPCHSDPCAVVIVLCAHSLHIPCSVADCGLWIRWLACSL